MFGGGGQLAVMNHRFSEMMNLSDDLIQRGASASGIIAACAAAGSISAASGRMILAEIENTQARDMITTDPDLTRGRSLSWTFQPMVGGGAVVLLEDITERRNAEARISHLARYDELTALPNRVNFRDEIGRLLAIQQGADQLSALLFVDLDQFKQVNDTYGHLSGDAVLAELAQILVRSARESDVCARYGGEEFAMILHETIEAGARTLAERIRAKVAAATFPGGLKLTISVGVAATDEPALFTQLIDRADQALYTAKQGGRNQVRVADMKGPAPKPHLTRSEAEPV
jgi:diguanylate cyclase (GGDEF)-like protein